MARTHILSFVGAVALTIGLVSCNDSATTEPTDSTSESVLKLHSESSDFLAAMQEVEAIDITSDDTPINLVGPDDPAGGGRGHDGRGHGGRDTLKDRHDTGKHHRDSVRHDRPNPGERRYGHIVHYYQRILSQLDLTDDQAQLIRDCFTAFKECFDAATTRYRQARADLIAEARAAVAELKQQVADGTLTPEEARQQLKALREQFRADMNGLNEAYTAAVRECRQALEECIKSHLTEEQLEEWHRLVGGNGDGSTGSNG
ncbi:MAG: hypothetical protein IPM61_15025 [Chlorobi bacterium]|nr:MAG: hypothetical protein UZ07_CHB004002294 [Chlorobi bacterium OLB7]MBK8912622.1 hypothetical protein [Chlorobiota bacterium]MBX7217833.1 hypothetical protein [Candidatus Kapabacteria bacterium]